jgi:dimeric dUTPase (all-alpha-NTP-PPase superfamily)
MTSKEYNLIKEMLQMQEKLDEAIMKEYGLDEIDEENLRMAILDEVGELTHELKANWCWWKKTQAPVDKEKVLGELVDIWHFVLSYQNHFNFGEEARLSYLNEEELSNGMLKRLRTKKSNLSKVLTRLVIFESSIIPVLIAISEYLGFTIEQVYECYCYKNKINYQRLKEGY